MAPPSGVKNSLSVVDLQALTSLPRERIQPILDLLAAKIVLRPRQPITPQGDVRFELYHDAFTRVLRPWISRALRRALIKRRLMQGAAAIAIVAAGALYFLREAENARHAQQLQMASVAETQRRAEIEAARDRAQAEDRIEFLQQKGNKAPRYAREVL